MLPRFLLADNFEVPEKVYVVHTIKPRFIVESNVDDFNVDQKVYWIDKEPANADEIEKLLADAEEYFNDEFEKIDEMFDDEGEDED